MGQQPPQGAPDQPVQPEPAPTSPPPPLAAQPPAAQQPIQPQPEPAQPAPPPSASAPVATQPAPSSPTTAEVVGANPIADVDVPFPLHDDEEVYAYLRRHWFALYPKIAGYLLLAVVPPAILVALGVELDFLDGTGATIVGVIVGIWILFWLVRLFFTWYSYNNDIWVVTDQRLVDSNKKNPLSHTVASTDLVNVTDTTVSVRGIFPSILKYGDVDCETAGSSNRFSLGSIPQPARVQALIDRLRDVARRETGRF